MSSGSFAARLGGWLTHNRSIGFGLEKLGYFTLRHPVIVGIFVIALSALALSQVPRANVDGDLLRVYAHSGPEYDVYERLSETFGTFENDIYLLVRSPNLTDPEVLERVRELSFDLELSEYASGTMSPFSLRTPREGGGSDPAVPEGMTTPEEVSAALTDLQQNDPMMKNLIMGDLDGVVMIMFPNPELTRVKGGTAAMIADLKELVAAHEGDGIEVILTGPPVWTAEMLNAAVDDQIKFTVYGFGLGALIALLSLRSLWAALLVAATPFVAVLWVMGLITLFFGAFSFLTIIVTTLVIVICFAESLFFTFNWLAYWRDGMDPREAVDATVKLVGPASALTMLVSMVSFGSLALTSGQGILEFSLAGTLGVGLIFICVMTFLPLLLKLVIRIGFKLPKTPSFMLSAPLPLSWFLATRFGRPIAIAAIATTALLLIPYFLIQPHFSFEDYVAQNSTALTAAEEIDEGVGGVAPIYINVPLREANTAISDADFERVRQVHEILEQLGENKAISAASFDGYFDNGFTRADMFDAMGPFMTRRFVSDDGLHALVTGFMPTVVDSEDLKTMMASLHADLAAAGITDAEVGGFRVMTTFATDNIVRGLQLDLTLSVVVNLFLIGFAFMSWRVAIASTIPNLFPILGTEAYLYLSGSGLELTTVLALTIAFGIAVDDTVHFLSHYLHGRRKEGRNHIDSVKHTLERIGGAIIATTIILCAGTAIVAFAELPQVALFGQLFVITLALALLGDLFILPALLVAGGKFFDPIGGSGGPYIPSEPPVEATGDAPATGEAGTATHL